MEDILMVFGRLLLAAAAALLPGTLVWGAVIGLYTAYRRLAKRLTLVAE